MSGGGVEQHRRGSRPSRLLSTGVTYYFVQPNSACSNTYPCSRMDSRWPRWKRSSPAKNVQTQLDRLAQLVGRSLVTIEPPVLDSTRYRLLETMRADAWERLVASGHAEQVQKRLADWIVLMADRAASAFHGPERARWLRWAEVEHTNSASSLEWLIDRQEAVAAMRVVAALSWRIETNRGR